MKNIFKEEYSLKKKGLIQNMRDIVMNMDMKKLVMKFFIKSTTYQEIKSLFNCKKNYRNLSKIEIKKLMAHLILLLPKQIKI